MAAPRTGLPLRGWPPGTAALPVPVSLPCRFLPAVLPLPQDPVRPCGADPAATAPGLLPPCRFLRASCRSCAATSLAPANSPCPPHQRGAVIAQGHRHLRQCREQCRQQPLLGALKVSNSSMNTARSCKNSGRLPRQGPLPAGSAASSSRSEGSIPVPASSVS